MIDMTDDNRYIRRGRLVTWCDHCHDFIDIPVDGYSGDCPRCGQPTLMRRCIRCGYEWWPLDPKRFASACPACKSPYYNRRRSIEYTRAPAKKRARMPKRKKDDPDIIEGLEI